MLGDREKFLEAGMMNEYIAKSVDKDMFLEVIGSGMFPSKGRL